MEHRPENIHILLVDDDERLQSAARDFLVPHGFRLSSLHNGDGLLEKLGVINPDIILLDVMLPGEDGFTLLERLRDVSQIPVIMLTARGGSEARVTGFDLGVDDYLTKPFDPRELVGRIRAVLRRVGLSQTPPTPPGVIRVGPVCLDARNQVLHCGKNSVMLSTTETRIIRAFMENAGRDLNRDELASLAFGDSYFGAERNIDVYISRVRNTLRKACGEKTMIQTVWGSGYRWVKE